MHPHFNSVDKSIKGMNVLMQKDNDGILYYIIYFSVSESLITMFAVLQSLTSVWSSVGTYKYSIRYISTNTSSS